MPLPCLWAGPNGSPRFQLIEVKAGLHNYLVLVEAEEILERDPQRDNVVTAAKYTLHYQLVTRGGFGQLIPPKSHTFTAGYDAQFNAVSVTSHRVHGNGAVFLDPAELRGTRVGTYLMNRLVTWVKQWPDAELKTIKLLPDQAQQDNKERRNRFYEQFGIQFSWHDAESRVSGTSLPITAAALKTTDAWMQTVTERSLVDYLAQLQHTAWQQQAVLQNCRRLNQQLTKVYRQPWRHAMGMFWNCHRSTILLGGTFIAMLLMAWYRHDGWPVW